MVVIEEKNIEIKDFSEVSEKLRSEWNEFLEKLLLMSNRNFIDKKVYDLILKYRFKFDVFNELFINTQLPRALISNEIKEWSENIQKGIQDLKSLDGKKEDYKKTAWKSVEEYIFLYLSPELKFLIDINKFEKVNKIADTTDINNVYVGFYKIFCYKIEIIKILVDLLVEKNDEFLSKIKAIEEEINAKYLNTLNEKEKSIQALLNSLDIKKKQIAEFEIKLNKALEKENALNEKEKTITNLQKELELKTNILKEKENHIINLNNKIAELENKIKSNEQKEEENIPQADLLGKYVSEIRKLKKELDFYKSKNAIQSVQSI